MNNIAKIKTFSPTTLHITSIVGADTECTGNIFVKTGIRIDGKYQGRILKRDGMQNPVVVHVSSTGEVHGDIIADIVIIEGYVKGAVVALQNLIIKGRIDGKAAYAGEVEMSGIVEANISKISGDRLAKIVNALIEPISSTTQEMIPVVASVDQENGQDEAAMIGVEEEASNFFTTSPSEQITPQNVTELRQKFPG
jgi:cytoskeletal protein CcmA (bactofilin family)